MILISAGLLVAGLGWFGRAFSLKHYERNQMHAMRGRGYRQQLEKLFPDNSYGEELRESMQLAHETAWAEETGDKDCKIVHARLYQAWLKPYWFVVALGVILCALGALIWAFQVAAGA